MLREGGWELKHAQAVIADVVQEAVVDVHCTLPCEPRLPAVGRHVQDVLVQVERGPAAVADHVSAAVADHVSAAVADHVRRQQQQ